MRTKEAILQELATEQAKLDELERELSTARAKIGTLRAELHTASAAKPAGLPCPAVVNHRDQAVRWNTRQESNLRSTPAG
jgi:hypothetical protein